MPKLDLVRGSAPAVPGGEFEIAFADEDGEQRLELTTAWSVPFESCLPVRGFPSYKGSSTTVPDMIGGRIDVMFGSAPSLLTHVRAGRIRALGITAAKRSAAAPDVPTVDESGVPGFESSTFGAFAGPAKTPRSIVGVLNMAIAKSAQSQEVASALGTQGTDTALMTPDQAGAYVRKQIAKWKKVVETAGIRPE